MKAKSLNVIRQMPELKHWDKIQPFAWENSDVCKWIAGQPEVLAFLYNKAVYHELIKFNPERGTWEGVPCQ